VALQQTFRPRLGVALVFCSAIAVFVVGGRVIQLTATSTPRQKSSSTALSGCCGCGTSEGGSSMSLDRIDVVSTLPLVTYVDRKDRAGFVRAIVERRPDVVLEGLSS